MRTTTYAGHGVEIEDDAIRLSRHHLEFEHDVRAALIRSRPRSRRLKALRPAALSAVVPLAAMTSTAQPTTLGAPMAQGCSPPPAG